MIVADTNLLAYLLMPGKRTGAAETVRWADPEWHAPLLWRSELRNVVTLQMRHRGLELSGAADVMGEARRLMRGREHQVDDHHVLRLARESGRSAYDCEFAALAEALSCPLVTGDRELAAAFPGLATDPEDFAGEGA